MSDERLGFLTKEGIKYKTWRKRWCALKDGVVYYSKKQGSASLGQIPLANASSIGHCDRKGKKHCFSVETPDRTYFLCAESEPHKQGWIAALCAARDRVQQSTSKDGVPAEVKKVSLEDFELLHVVGKGSYGKVMQVRKKDTSKIYAMKILKKKAIADRDEIEHTKAEKSILQRLVHPFLVNLHYSFQNEENLFLVMDFVNGGELFFHLQRDRKFNVDRVRFYVAEIVLGLEYLHANGVLYRDLKPENLLLTEDGHICMTDFGISKEGLVGENDRTTTFCGTPEYLAPEVLMSKPYGKAVDWWSLGTLMYEMLTGLPPFYTTDIQQMYTKIMTQEPEAPKNLDPDAKHLMQSLMIKDPARRLADPVAIKAHPFFKTIDWNKLFDKEIKPPFVPKVKGSEDINCIDTQFTSEPAVLTPSETTPLPADLQMKFRGFTFTGDGSAAAAAAAGGAASSSTTSASTAATAAPANGH